MRCKCCDSVNTQLWGDPEPDWYCAKCIEAIIDARIPEDDEHLVDNDFDKETE